MKTWILSLFLALFASGNVFASGTNFVIDPAHSFVTFSIEHMVISKVKGDFSDLRGKLFWDEADLNKSNISCTISAATVNTRNRKRDGHLRSSDFFDVAKYPEITFKSTKVSTSLRGFTVEGELSLHGVTKTIKIPFTKSEMIKDGHGKLHVGFEGNFTINRQDYGMNYSKVMDNGGLMVGNTVDISVTLEAVSTR